jgi:hypothetical protein
MTIWAAVENHPVLGEFLEIMRQWESDKVRGNAAATGMNRVLMVWVANS